MDDNLPKFLEAERIYLKAYDIEDAKEFYLVLVENREYLKPYINEASTINSINDAKKRIMELINDWNTRTRFVLGIWLKSSKSYIGQIWIEPNNWDVPSFELGWFLALSQQRQGLAIEAGKIAIQFIFNHLKAHKIIVITRDDNFKSYTLAERLGFVKEGHLRDHSVKKDGTRVGLDYYGMLKSNKK